MTNVDKKRSRWSKKKSLFLSMIRVKNVYIEVSGGQKGQNCVYVVIECPPTKFKLKPNYSKRHCSLSSFLLT